jgi:hypothetical protein
MEQVRARTTSPSPALRFLLMGVALLIMNMWIRLHWLFYVAGTWATARGVLALSVRADAEFPVN